MRKIVKYKGAKDRAAKVAANQALGLTMLSDTFYPGTTLEDEGVWEMVFTDEPRESAPPLDEGSVLDSESVAQIRADIEGINQRVTALEGS